MYKNTKENYLEGNLDIGDLPYISNIAEYLEGDLLLKIGKCVVDGYEADEQSREGWLKRYENAIKLATQVEETKNYPWPNAANVKFPVTTVACLQFHAKAYPALVPSRDLVQVKVTGRDFMGFKRKRAERIMIHMNYQLLSQMEEWDEHMDKMLITLPITGTEFKKTYWDSSLKRNVSKHVPAKDLVVNYWAKSLDSAYRKTEIIELTKNEIQERINRGVYLDEELGDPVPRDDKPTQVKNLSQGVSEPQADGATPFYVLECHTWYDLDGDGYEEPYIITVEKASRKVLRIVARFQKEGISKKQGKILQIIADEYYTKFPFIPSPDGGFYDMGFGTLIGPLNDAVNTLINQLIDAGTLSNLQSGYISRSFRAKGGSSSFSPGEWKVVNATGQDLRNGIFPLPVKEPSGVLFNLLGLLIEAGQRVTSTTDMMVGENPGQNQKATTTMAVMEQGQKVFTAIFKRIRRALTSEFKKIYSLNKEYIDEKEYYTIIDPTSEEAAEIIAIGGSDYEDDSLDVSPTADPNSVSPMQKMARAQAILSTVELGANVREALRRFYDALEVEDPESLLPPPPEQTPPDPELILEAREQDRKELETKVKSEALLRQTRVKEVEAVIKEKAMENTHSANVTKIATDAEVKAMGITTKHMTDSRANEIAEKKNNEANSDS